MINERIWNEAPVAQFKVLSGHLPEETEENNEKRQDSLSPGRDLNPGCHKYEAGELTMQMRLLVPQIASC
jgi:hypothetical protein